MSPDEKYYHPGITERTPILDYPEHHNRHALEGKLVEAELDLPPAPDWRYEPPPVSTQPRMEAFIVFCIDYRVEVACALWAIILGAWATALWLWVWG